jgi:chromosomal replication initiation ATPase DnaA
MLDGGGLWRAARAEVAQVMTPANVNAWLATTRALDQDGAVLRVAVPAPFTKTWLEQKLHGTVMAALHTIDGDALGVERVGRVEDVVVVAA